MNIPIAGESFGQISCAPCIGKNFYTYRWTLDPIQNYLMLPEEQGILPLDS